MDNNTQGTLNSIYKRELVTIYTYKLEQLTQSMEKSPRTYDNSNKCFTQYTIHSLKQKPRVEQLYIHYVMIAAT